MPKMKVRKFNIDFLEWHTIYFRLFYMSVPDPGFPGGGGRQLQRWMWKANFCSKTAWNWNNLDPRGERTPGAHLDPPMRVNFRNICLTRSQRNRPLSKVFCLHMPFPETWYVMERGADRDGCGRSVEFPCETLLYLLQQVNRTHRPPSTEIHISTDKSLIIDQQIAVSCF